MPLTDHEIGEQIRENWRMRIPPLCPRCGYNITGLPRNRCPECGRVFDWLDVAKRAQTLWFRMLALRQANSDAKTGLRFAAIGLAAVGATHLIGLRGLLGAMIDLCGLFLSLFAFILGAQVLNAIRLPAWAKSYVPEPPKWILGLAATLLSLALFAVSAYFLVS